jgi:hypothetical protein
MVLVCDWRIMPNAVIKGAQGLGGGNRNKKGSEYEKRASDCAGG